MENAVTGPQSLEESRSDPSANDSSKQDLTVIGIGASAGGVEALQQLFTAMPVDTGFTFVIILHLAPDQRSLLPEVLSACTPMPVEAVREKTEMVRNHVYVIAPNQILEIKDGCLNPLKEVDHDVQKAPIDIFFRSLANEYGDGAAIILSGAGTDGTVGIKAIKENGGIILVQLPEEAQYDSMPRSAIASGLVDLVLPVQELPQKLIEIKSTGNGIRRNGEDVPLVDAEVDSLQKILTQVRVRTGHDFSAYKRSTLIRRISRRMQLRQLHDLGHYLTYLRDHTDEVQGLFKDLLISVTNFFRDEESFRALEQEVIPILFHGKSTGDVVRVWCVGCATGEEAYSLAMLLSEYCSRLDTPPQIQVFASDLDEEALTFAREGTYAESIAADVSEERIKRFFTREGNYYKIKADLREMVLFAPHNLLKDPPFSRLDLVTCRNLLIYLNRDLQTRVFESFHYALHSRGYLFLGSAESAEGVSELFRPIDKKNKIYQKKEHTHGIVRLPMLPLTSPVSRRRKLTVEEVSPEKNTQTQRTTSSAIQLHHTLLKDHTVTSVLVDENYDIVHLSDTAGRFLQLSGGVPTNNIIKLLRKELQIEVRTSLYQAFEKGQPVTSRSVWVRFNGDEHLVHVVVYPGQEENRTKGLALVVFNDIDKYEADAHIAKKDSAEIDPFARQLEEELVRTRERLQTAIEEYETSNEELKAANEELQSINEEYKSTLEELETSKEELQSVNEELQTLNQELKNKVDELSHANSDLQNLMTATEIGTLFLDRDKRIKRYTNRITELFNIMPSDRGRPINHLTHLMKYEHLADDVDRVIKDLVTIENEIQSKNGRWYLVRLKTYRTLEDRIDGVVITFVDITGRRNAEDALRISEERFRVALANSPIMVFKQDAELRYTWVYNTLFPFGEQKIIGCTDAEVAILRERADAIMDLKKAALHAGVRKQYEFDLVVNGKMMAFSLSIEPVFSSHNLIEGLYGTLVDVTEQKKTQRELEELNDRLESRVRERTGQVRNLASQLTMAEQLERRRIALVLHDDLQQILFGTQMKLEGIRSALNENQTVDVTNELLRVDVFIDKAINLTRTLSSDLNPPLLEASDFTALMVWLSAHMGESYGLQVHLANDRPLYIENEQVRLFLYHIVRELLFNIVKHAHVKTARLELVDEGNIKVIVSDEGKGFDVSLVIQEHDKESGTGLARARERLKLIGGSLGIESQPGSGTRIIVQVPPM